jgi:hypothetical protein
MRSGMDATGQGAAIISDPDSDTYGIIDASVTSAVEHRRIPQNAARKPSGKRQMHLMARSITDAKLSLSPGDGSERDM